VFLEELDQILPRNASILGTRDPVSLQAAGVEPLADNPGMYLADLANLARRVNLHCDLLILKILSSPAKLPPRGKTLTVQ